MCSFPKSLNNQSALLISKKMFQHRSYLCLLAQMNTPLLLTFEECWTTSRATLSLPSIMNKWIMNNAQVAKHFMVLLLDYNVYIDQTTIKPVNYGRGLVFVPIWAFVPNLVLVYITPTTIVKYPSQKLFPHHCISLSSTLHYTYY